MLGLKSSLFPLKAKLANCGITNVIVATFSQGKTQRWALGWTFDESIDLKSVDGMKAKKKQPPPMHIDFPETDDHEEFIETLSTILNDLAIRTKRVKSGVAGCWKFEAVAFENTWMNSRRKRRELQRLDAESAAKRQRTSICLV